ncbi:MAG: hypothetical protein JXR18_12515 [Neptuniibacter sp.]
MDEKMTEKLPKGETDSLLKSATEAARNGELATAIPRLKQLLEVDPDHQLGLGMLASIYLQTGMNEESGTLFEHLLQKHPENPLARFQYGLTKLNSGSPEEAIELWQPLFSDEENFMAHFHGALACLQMGNNADASQHLQISAVHMPNSHPLYPQLVELLNSLSKVDA